MNDMTKTIEAKSDQLNADDLIGREMTIKITGVTVKGGQEQPVSIHFEGDNGKPYKACKSMCRVMVAAWGPDSSKYVGRSMTLYRDPKVKWAGMEVGGIRISHMSDIPDDQVMALTVTRGSKKPYTVKPLIEHVTRLDRTSPPAPEGQQPITAAAHKRLEARIKELGADRDKLKAYVKQQYGIEHLNELTKDAYKAVDAMLDKKAKQQSGLQKDVLDAIPPVEETSLSDRIAACKTVAELDALAETLDEDTAAIYFDTVARRKGELTDGEGGGL